MGLKKLIGAPLRTTLTGLVAGFLVLAAAPAYAAAEGSIDHVEQNGDQVRVLYSVSGVPDNAKPDYGSVQVTMNGSAIDATAEAASTSTNNVRRTAVIVMDSSKSMAGEKFTQAKSAADTFLSTVPDDVYVGLVVFAGDVVRAQDPTRDRDAVRNALDALKLSAGTSLYDGLIQAVDVAGTEGSRSLLVLSDGRDTTDTKIKDATTAIKKSGVKVDVVNLSKQNSDVGSLTTIANAGDGAVLSSDPGDLTSIFAAEAQTLEKQVLVSFSAPDSKTATEGTLKISLTVGSTDVSGSAFVAMEPTQAAATPPATATDLKPAQLDTGVPRLYMFVGLAGAGAALLVLLITAFGGLTPKRDQLSESISAYSRRNGGGSHAAPPPPPGETSLTASAVGVAEKALAGNKGLEVKLGQRLDAAGMSLKPAEWLLLHAGITFGLGIAGLILGGTNLMFMILGLVVGAVGPWVYLRIRHSRRLKAFSSNLANTLQLMSGSLSAGLSLAQGVDTVVREGTEPIAGEFRRALVEARLGVELEDALEGVAERMQSRDFEWVVMAIRIQREVGGNLAELLNSVAQTIREREYLERQVKALSAEGRLSVWVLGGLAPGFLVYLSLANPSYLSPMFTDPRGWIMLGVMAVMETVGVFWMLKLVKVDV